MWIHHIGEIMIGAVVLLVLAHLGLHFVMKSKKAKQSKQAQQESENS